MPGSEARMGVGAYIATAAGALLIGIALYDAFRTLFYPEGRGALNNLLVRASWKVFTMIGHRLNDNDRRHRFMRLAGPVIFGVIVLTWTALLALGFGLLYLPHLADEFRISSGLPPQEQTSYFDAVYFSFSALSSTGFGDLSAKTDPIRAITMFEGITGTVMIGIGLSWLLSLYPAIGRRRTTAESIALHGRIDFDPASADPSLARDRILMLTDRILEVSRDLAKFPILYYFMETRTEASLPRQIGALEWAQQRALKSEDAGVRTSAELLDGAMGSLRTTLRDRFLNEIEDEGEGGDVLQQFRSDHLIAEEEAQTPGRDDPGRG